MTVSVDLLCWFTVDLLCRAMRIAFSMVLTCGDFTSSQAGRKYYFHFSFWVGLGSPITSCRTQATRSMAGAQTWAVRVRAGAHLAGGPQVALFYWAGRAGSGRANQSRGESRPRCLQGASAPTRSAGRKRLLRQAGRRGGSRWMAWVLSGQRISSPMAAPP